MAGLLLGSGRVVRRGPEPARDPRAPRVGLYSEIDSPLHASPGRLRLGPMVRPDANPAFEAQRVPNSAGGARCTGLAGGSPVAVIAGEPRSRLQLWGEIPPAERSVESPQGGVGRLGGERSCGPSPKRTLQPREMEARKGGMAEPLMSRRRQQTAPARSGGVQDVPGVWRRARSDSPVWNRRGPTRPPTSGKDPTYKPKVKWEGVGRESEGPVVPPRPGESREEGRGPALVVLGCGGKDEGMP